MQSGPRLKPCKRQTAPAAGRGRQPFTGRGYFFERFNGSPRSFPGFCCGGNCIAGAQRRRMQRGQDIPHVKGLKKTKGLRGTAGSPDIYLHF
ncbi:MAG: hypothetical protein JRI33_02760 [Deltaproteobacteria bacterium]|nr:hypothetical protein [Deltaproteobacteria bacterium]